MPVADMYLRLSESDDASTAIARQEADLQALFDREGWTLGKKFVDDGLSGGYDREKANAALERLRTGESDVLAVWKFDRWSRQGLGAVAKLIDAIDANPRGLFVAERDGLRSSQPAWRIIASVLAEVARMERENIQLRVRSSIAALKRDGRYSGGNIPYGYMPAKDPDGPGRVLVHNPAETEIVHEAARRVLAGESMYRVTLDLNARKIPTRRGRTWSVTALRQILVSDAIVGRVTHAGELIRDADGLPVEVWTAVLDSEIWHRLRAVLEVEKTGKERKQRTRRSRLLSGIATCGQCSRPLYVKYNGTGFISYGCSARSNGRQCAGAAMKAEALEQWVTEQFLAQVGALEVFEHIVELPEVAALADVEAAIAATAAKMASDDADIAALTSRLATLKNRRTELKARPAERVVKLVGTGQTFAQLWHGADDERRNAILAENIAILAVRKGKRAGRGPIDTSKITLHMQPSRLPDEATPGIARVYAEAA